MDIKISILLLLFSHASPKIKADRSQPPCGISEKTKSLDQSKAEMTKEQNEIQSNRCCVLYVQQDYNFLFRENILYRGRIWSLDPKEN